MDEFEASSRIIDLSTSIRNERVSVAHGGKGLALVDLLYSNKNLLYILMNQPLIFND